MQNRRGFFFFPTVPAKYILFPESHNYISSTEREREITNKNVVCTKCILLWLFILFVLSRIKLVLHFVVNIIMCRREKKNNNNVGKFVKKCKNCIFVIFILLVKIQNLFNLLMSTRKSVAERKKDICHLNVYVAKLNLFHETKQFPEKNVPSQTCLAWVSSQ